MRIPFALSFPAVLTICLLLAPKIALADSPAVGADTDERINELVGKMTLQEKLGQMSQAGFPEKPTDKLRNEIAGGRWGSFYGGAPPAMKAEIQQIALKKSRLGIPLIFGADLI